MKKRITSVLLALFVWSPVSGRLVAQYATKTPSYWRVFWLIPVGPICAYSTVWLTEKLPRRWMHLAGVLVCSALLAKYGVEYVILYRQCGIPQDCLLRAGWHIAAGTDNYVLMTCADELSPTQQG